MCGRSAPLSGKLNSRLMYVDRQAQPKLDSIIRQIAQGVTEAPKATDPMEWAWKMNNI